MGNIEQRITVVKIARRARASTTAWPREEKREWVAVVNSTEASFAGEVTSVVAVVAVKSGKEKKEYGVAQRERSRIASDWYSLWCVCVCRGSRIAALAGKRLRYMVVVPTSLDSVSRYSSY